MKKFLLVALAIAVAFTFSSCKKDGAFNPKQRIEKISESRITTRILGNTTSVDSINPYVSEEWTWSGKILSYITLKDRDGSENGKIVFKYDDKNRITDMTDGYESAIYSYNDKKRLETIKIYDGQENIETFTFAYDGKTLTSIVDTLYDVNSVLKSNLVGRIFPAMLAERFAVPENISHVRGARELVTALTLEWDGKNISQVTSLMTAEGFKSTATYTYEYDDKLNPYCGMYAMYGTYGDEICLSKNNAIKVTLHSKYEGDNGVSLQSSESTTVTEYSYEYDGKFPTSVSHSSTFTIGENTTTTKYTTYYEYED